MQVLGKEKGNSKPKRNNRSDKLQSAEKRIRFHNIFFLYYIHFNQILEFDFNLNSNLFTFFLLTLFNKRTYFHLNISAILKKKDK